MRKSAFTAAMVSAIISLGGCGSKAVPQDGTVSFTLLGKPYELKQMRFIIQPVLLLSEKGESEDVRPAKPDHRFEFDIKPTKEFFDEKKAASEGAALLNLWWYVQSDSPESLLSSNTTFSLNTMTPKVEKMSCSLMTSDFQAVEGVADPSTQQPSPENCQVTIDEFTDGRVKGHFSATWLVVPSSLSDTGRAMTTQTASVSDGKFDLPYVKLFK